MALVLPKVPPGNEMTTTILHQKGFHKEEVIVEIYVNHEYSWALCLRNYSADVVVSLQPRGGLAAVMAAVRRGSTLQAGSVMLADRQASCMGRISDDVGTSRPIEGGIKPFVCGWCPYRALRRGDMKKHLRTHTGEKPYLCPSCAFRSADSSALHRHIRARHPHHQVHLQQQKQYEGPAPLL
ncbi:hypothetical protein OTU49_015005 [Cherax quadricarinatus]|uniref:C2H2-type domain-containing protein n=1 Tax=Cherax quadricarinatus TaxID=27406 RepID=A0AAW0YFR3_CHEQU